MNKRQRKKHSLLICQHFDYYDYAIDGTFGTAYCKFHKMIFHINDCEECKHFNVSKHHINDWNKDTKLAKRMLKIY